MRILATGGAGYIGSACVRAMLKQGFECWAYDNLSTGYAAAVPEGRLIQGDTSDHDKLVAVMQEHKIEAVMHFAACIAVGESVEKPRLYYRNNIANALTLLEAMQDAGVGKIVFSSTAAVYAPSDESLNEESIKNPASPYAFSKFAVERIIRDFSQAYGLGYTVLRYFNACGADADGNFGEAHNPETHLIPLVLQVPLGQREYISVFGNDYDTPDGTCIRDYIHVNDLADAHIRAIQAVKPATGTAYNIGTGTGNSVLEVINAAQEVTGQKIETRYAPRRAGDTARLVAGAEKLKQELNWQPQYADLKSIIETAWKWHKSHPNGYE